MEYKGSHGWFLVIGIIFIVLGSLAFIFSFWSTLISVIVLGALLIGGGVAHAVQSFKLRDCHDCKDCRGCGVGAFLTHLFIGVLQAVVGGMMIFRPGVSALSVTLVLAVFFIASGIFRIIAALDERVKSWGLYVTNGLVSVILGGLILAQWPVSGLWALGVLIGVDLIISGWTSIALWSALRHRSSLASDVK